MKRAVALIGAVAVFVAAADLTAQDTPSFAGSWTMVADANAPPPGARGGGGRAGGGGGRAGGGGGRMGGGMGALAGLGPQATITQDANTLTVVRATQAGEVRSVYNLDGSPSRNTIMAGGNTVEPVSRARWDAGKLVITTAIDFGGNQIETTMSLSLDASGNLVVESTGMGRGGAGGGATTTRYTKG